MLETIMMILFVVLLVLGILCIRANIWYWKDLKRLDEARKQYEKQQYEKLSKEYEAELAERPSEEEK